MFSTHVILTPGACWGGAELQSVDQIRGIRGDPGDPGMQSFLSVTFSYPSLLKPMVLRCFLDNDLPKTVSKGMIPLRRSLKKSKKHQAIAPAALGGCGGLGQLWEALAELREALGELWEGLDC